MVYIVGSILSVLFTFLCWICINWWAPIFAIGNKLPNWLKWVDTFDADLDTGNRELGWNNGYWGRVSWLNRNPAYGFNYYVLGIKWKPETWYVNYFNPNTILDFKAQSTEGHFNYHFVKFGLDFKFGWKAWNMFLGRDAITGYPVWKKQWGPEKRIPLTFSITKA